MEGIMEDIEFEVDEPEFSIDEANDDFCNSILFRFGDSTNEKHQHLCAVIGAMSQELKDNNLPSSPVAYFAAACSSLDCILSEPSPSNHVVATLLFILSLVIARIPVAVLKMKSDLLSELVQRVLESPSVSDDAVISGLKCLSHLLIHRKSVDWKDVSKLFSVLVGFLTDSRPKVRRQSHFCHRDVLLNFQKSSLLASASKEVTDLLQRFTLLAREGTKVDQQVLYILDALKECLPLLSLDYKTIILECFKTLLDYRQPPVTRCITDGLSFLCHYPTSEVSPEALLELLSSLALSISLNDMSGDGMTFTARLLDAGMNKIYCLNRQICIIKLPVVFSALKDIFASEHEEAIYAATDALKSMINSCIDESLIKQGVDQISLSANRESRRSGPSIIENICATIEGLLDYQYTDVWDRVFQVASAMFHKLGNYSPYFMRGILKNLEDVQKLPDEDFPFSKQLHECIGSALVAMGPETLLSLIPLNLETEDLSDANIWLFPILKQYTVGAHLSYFTKEILAMIERVGEKAHKLEAQGLMVSSRNSDALAYSLWSLLPSFCNYPVDTVEGFKHLVGPLCSKLEEEPDIRGIICTSLRLLVQQNKNIVDANDKDYIGQDMAKEQGLVHYSQQVATDNLNVLKSSAEYLLKALSKVFLTTTKDEGGCLQHTIWDIASIADRAVVYRLFMCRMQELHKCTKEARARLLDFAVSLLPGLNDEEIKKLFCTIQPALQDVDGAMQKKAYKGLSIILRSSDSFVSSKFEELLKLLDESLPSCHFSAKHHRLDCLFFLVVHALKSKDNLKHSWQDIFGFFLTVDPPDPAHSGRSRASGCRILTEIILALKEDNKKTRNRAYDILIQIGHAFGDKERGGNRENLDLLFKMVAGSLAGETPHMQSAAAKGLACLAYEFSDLVSTAFNLLPSKRIFLQGKSRGLVKATLGLLKVLIAKSQAEGLQMHLRSLVEGLLKCQDNTKNHFKAKVKLLLQVLVKKCGLEAVKAVMPEEHMKLLSNIHKIMEQKERKRGAKSMETKSHLSKATMSRQSMWNHTKIFSDFDEDSSGSDAEFLNSKTISGRGKSSSHFKSAASSFRSNVRLKKNLPGHLSDQSDDEPLDLLDRQKTRSALRSSEHLKRKSRLDDEVEVDSEGRLIICEEGEQKEKPTEHDFDTRSEPDGHLSAKSGAKAQKRRKTSDSGWAYTGKEYASKRASGDVKRKDKLEPYAYWPLDRKMISRRPQQRAVARKGMASVVKMTKKLEGKSASGVLSLKSLRLKRTQKKGS